MDTHRFWGMATPDVAKVLQVQTGKTRIPREWRSEGEGQLLVRRKTTWGLGAPQRSHLRCVANYNPHHHLMSSPQRAPLPSHLLLLLWEGERHHHPRDPSPPPSHHPETPAPE